MEGKAKPCPYQMTGEATLAQPSSSKLMQLGDHAVIALPGFMGLRIFIARTPIPHPLVPPLSPILLLRHFIHDRLEGFNARVGGDAVTEVEDVAGVAGIVL